MPIFGWIGNLFLMGKIDEIRWRNDTKDLEVSEFKTRTKPHLPGRAQQDTHKLQIMIYQVFQISQVFSLQSALILNFNSFIQKKF